MGKKTKKKKSHRDVPSATSGRIVSVVPVLQEKREEFPLMSYLIRQRERLDPGELSEDLSEVVPIEEGDVIGRLEISKQTSPNDGLKMSNRMNERFAKPDVLRETEMANQRERALQKLHALESESRKFEKEQLLASASSQGQVVGNWTVSPLPVKKAEQEYFPGTQHSKVRKKSRSSSKSNARTEPFLLPQSQIVHEPPRHHDVGPQLANVWHQKPGSSLFDKRDDPHQLTEEEELRWALLESTRQSNVNTSSPYLCGGDRWSTEVPMRPKIVGLQLQEQQTLECFVKVDKSGMQYIDKEKHHRPKGNSTNNRDTSSSQNQSGEYLRSVAAAQTVETGLVSDPWNVQPCNANNEEHLFVDQRRSPRGHQNEHDHRSNEQESNDRSERENTRYSQVNRHVKAKSDKKIPPLIPELGPQDDRQLNAPDEEARSHSKGRERRDVKPKDNLYQYDDYDESKIEDRRVRYGSRYDQVSRSDRDKVEAKGLLSSRERRREQPKYMSASHREGAARVRSAEHAHAEHPDRGDTRRVDSISKEKSPHKVRRSDRDVGDHKRKHISQPGRDDNQKQGIDRQTRDLNGRSNTSHVYDTKPTSESSKMTETNQTGALAKSSNGTEFLNHNVPQNEKRLMNKVPTVETESQIQPHNESETQLLMANAESNAREPMQDFSDINPECQTFPASQNVTVSPQGGSFDIYQLMQYMYHVNNKPSEAKVPNMQGQPGPDFSYQQGMPPQNYATHQQMAFQLPQMHGGQQFTPHSQSEMLGQEHQMAAHMQPAQAAAHVPKVEPDFNTWTPPTARGPQTKHKMQQQSQDVSSLQHSVQQLQLMPQLHVPTNQSREANGLPQPQEMAAHQPSHHQNPFGQEAQSTDIVQQLVATINNLCIQLQSSGSKVGQQPKPNVQSKRDNQNEAILNAVAAVDAISRSPKIDPIVAGQCRLILNIVMTNQTVGRNSNMDAAIMQLLVSLCDTTLCDRRRPSEGSDPGQEGPLHPQFPETLPPPPKAWVTGVGPPIELWQKQVPPDHADERPRSSPSPHEVLNTQYVPNPHFQQHTESLGMPNHVQYLPVDMAQFYRHHQQVNANPYFAAQRSQLNPLVMPHYGIHSQTTPYGYFAVHDGNVPNPDPSAMQKVEPPQPFDLGPRFSGPPGIQAVRVGLGPHSSVDPRMPFSTSSPRFGALPTPHHPPHGEGN